MGSHEKPYRNSPTARLAWHSAGWASAEVLSVSLYKTLGQRHWDKDECSQRQQRHGIGTGVLKNLRWKNSPADCEINNGIIIWLFKTGFLCEALAVLELAL